MVKKSNKKTYGSGSIYTEVGKENFIIDKFLFKDQ